MIPFGCQAHGTTSSTLLRCGGRRPECSSGGHPPASVTAPLSRQVHGLEDEVGTKLFVRSQSWMRLFRQRFPMVEFGVRELQYHQQVQELINQPIDLGYVTIRFPELESELVFECVRKAPFLVAFRRSARA